MGGHQFSHYASLPQPGERESTSMSELAVIDSGPLEAGTQCPGKKREEKHEVNHQRGNTYQSVSSVRMQKKPEGDKNVSEEILILQDCEGLCMLLVYFLFII